VIGAVGFASAATAATCVYQGNGFNYIIDADPPADSLDIEVGQDIAISDPPVGSWTLVVAPVPSIQAFVLYTLVPVLLVAVGLVAMRWRSGALE
jgi:hypothetical protein